MPLEIISRCPEGAAKPHPLLFVHGSFTGAAVWDIHFLPYFARHGYSAHALSLRGHGASPGRDNLANWSLADYVADLAQAAAELQSLPSAARRSREPVLIGHSLGGMVIQKYLESHAAAGLVLMASVPPHGLLSSLWGMAASNPVLLYRLGLIQSFGFSMVTPEVMRQALFSERTPDSRLWEYLPLLQGESQRVSLDMLGLNPLRLHKAPAIPMLVMGAGRDAFFSTGLIRDMARHYGADCAIFPDIAHAMMLESHWQQPAEHLLGWLDRHFAH